MWLMASPSVVGMTVLLALTAAAPLRAESTREARRNAFALYDAGRYPEAIVALDAVLASRPRDYESLLKRGICSIRMDQPSRALVDFDNAIRFNPLYPDSHSYRGIALLALGRYDEALASFERARRYWTLPLNAARGLELIATGSTEAGLSMAHSGMAQVYHRTGRSQDALAEYDIAIGLYPQDFNAFIGRGDVHAALGDRERALADYNEAVRIRPNASRALSGRGRLLSDLGREDEALNDFERALQADPQDPFAHSLRGAAFARRGQNEQALAEFDEVIRLRPGDAGGYKDRGGVLVRMGQNERALEDLNRAIKLDPNQARAFLNRGAAYSNLRQYERAIDDLDKAIALEPENAAAYTNRGLAEFMVARHERALASLGEAVRLAPRNAVVHLNRGNVYARLGFRDQAVADYAAVERLDAQLIASFGGPARLLEEMGRQSLAVRDKGEGLRADHEAEIGNLLEQGHALRDRSDWPGAIDAYSRALTLDPGRAEVFVARGWTRLCAGVPGAEADARAYLEQKGWRDRLSPYMALLGALATRQAGKDLQAQGLVDEVIAQTPAGTWPLPLLHYLRHDLTTAALLAAAKTESQQTEAHAIAALEILRRGDRKTAREHLEWVRDHGSRRSVAFDLARATLGRTEAQPPQSFRTTEGPRQNPIVIENDK